MNVAVAFTTITPSTTQQKRRPKRSTSLTTSTTFQPANIVVAVRLSSSVPPNEETETTVTSTSVTKSADGTFYDDEVDPIPVTKVGLSDSMKQRLINEASTGLDSDKAQNNVILYIIGIVSVLVLLGGKDILY